MGLKIIKSKAKIKGVGFDLNFTEIGLVYDFEKHDEYVETFGVGYDICVSSVSLDF